MQNPPSAIVFATDQKAADAVVELLEELACTVSVQSKLAEPSSATGSSPINGSTGANAGSPQTPCCIVLAGPLSELMAADRFAETQAVFPGVPLVAAWEPVSVDEAIQVMRHGAASILVLGQPKNQQINSLRTIVTDGQRSASRNAELRALITRLSTLTQAEEQVLEAMLEGLANKQIAQSLQIGLRTVELRRSKIMRKMEAKSLAELVKFVCVARNAGAPSSAAPSSNTGEPNIPEPGVTGHRPAAEPDAQ